MARSMNLDVLVRLRDRFTGPMRRLKNNLKSLANVGRQIGVIGTAIAAISFIAPIREAAAFEQQLLDIAGTAELTGKAAFDFARKAGRQYEDLALKIGQTSEIIASGAGGMIAAGVDEGVINRNIETIGKAATAANSEMSDMTAVATSLLKTLNVPETELEGAISSLVVAGKEGAFELKDMAKYFPQLTSQMRKFGVTGRGAVDFLGPALQIAKTGASDPSVAANNLNNFLSKALAPVTQKAFREMGVDIQAVMLDAAAKGINPIEAMIQKVGHLTGVSEQMIGRYMSRAEAQGLKGADALDFVRQQLEAIGAAGSVGELFGDQQVLDFIVPFLAQVDEYKRIKGAVSQATGEVIDKDFETQIAGKNRQLAILGDIGTQAIRFVGSAFGTWLPTINKNLKAMLAFVRRLDAATGGWVTQAVVAAGGGLLFAGALGALGLALPIVIAGFSALASIVAIALGPIGIAAALLAGTAVHIGRNWDRYGPRIMRAWNRTKRGFSNFAGEVVDRGRDIVRSGRDLVDRYGPSIREGVGRTWEGVSRIVRNAASRLPDLSQLTAQLPALGTIRTAGLEALADVMERFRAIGAGALDRLTLMLETVKRFFVGFSGEAAAMGIGFNEAMTEISALASSLGGLFDDILEIGDRLGGAELGIDWKALLGNGAEGIGSFIGREIGLFGKDVASAAREIRGLVDAARNAIPQILGFFEGLAGKIVSTIGKIDFIANFENPVPAILEWFTGLPGRIMEAIGSIDLSGLISWPSMPSWLGGSDDASGSTKANGSSPANSNTPRKQSSVAPTRAPTRQLASAQPAARADVSGTIQIAVEGPGKVTSAKSSNSRVAMAPSRGRRSNVA